VEVLHVGEAGFEWLRPERPSREEVCHLTCHAAAVLRTANLSLSEHAEALRNGTATVNSCSVSLAEQLLLRRHALEGLRSVEMLEEALADPELRGAFAGGAFLAMGAAGSGGCFHEHQDALLVQLVGQKRWFVNKCRRKHGTLHEPLTDDEVRTGRARDLLRKTSPEEHWTCTQSPGDLTWVPEGLVPLVHSVRNLGEISMGISLQEAEIPNPITNFLWRAANDGHAAAIHWLLAHRALDPESAREEVDEGSSPRAALWLGHADATRALVEFRQEHPGGPVSIPPSWDDDHEVQAKLEAVLPGILRDQQMAHGNERAVGDARSLEAAQEGEKAYPMPGTAA